MAGEARVIRASIYIELLEARPRRSAADSIRSVSEVEEEQGQQEQEEEQEGRGDGWSSGTRVCVTSPHGLQLR
eukprot:COSAG02_NODE_15707_length_1147_cov_1.018130_2_plen_73_part_00